MKRIDEIDDQPFEKSKFSLFNFKKICIENGDYFEGFKNGYIKLNCEV